MKKVIFFDMDGTLLYRKNENDAPAISKKTQEVLRKVQEKGHLIFIATGRPYAFLDKDVVDFGFDGYVLSNGAVVLYHEHLLYHAPMKKQLIETLINDFETRKIEYIMQTKEYSYMNKENKLMKAFYDRCSVNYDYIKTEDFTPHQLLDDIVKLEMLPVGEENIAFCRSLEGDDFAMMGNPPFTFELYSKNTSKATGILKVLEKLNIDVQDSYAFGDGPNDIEMLQTVGHGIAMGNAPEHVKEHADEVCLPVDQDGVACKLEELFL
ncbi:MAG: HAD family hydrolase [Beduini sp.]|uniref:HAD family hydrolase n=1 Tax=Beduini sp. TaxID=1922300 RepID=UPI0039A20719